jgi:arylsulfatase A-like enzyme
MNLVLIVSDTLRWDYLGCYGNNWIATPNLDELASESAVFVDAYAEGLPTLPARRAILTGRQVTPARYIHQPSDAVANYGWHPFFDQDVTAAEWLDEKGFCNGFVTDVYHMMKPGKNYHRGFHYWDWVRGQEGDMYALRDKAQVMDMLEQLTIPAAEVAADHWVVQHLNVRKDWKSDADTSVAKVMATAADWVNNYTLDDPFFLYVDCFDPHEPWDPPADYAEEYYPDYHGYYGVRPSGTTEGLSEDQWECIKAAYAGEVTLVDAWVGHLLATLHERELMDDTLIVFTADHGTMMGEQGEIHKGESRLRNQCTRVPLLIRHPEGVLGGEQIEGFVQHHDILPTALGIMGLDVPDRVTGSNVWPMATGEQADERDSIFIGWSRYCSVRTAEWNLTIPLWEDFIREDEEPVRELYDLREDPEELTNVITEHPDVARELAQLAQEYIAAQRELTKGTIQQPDEVMSKDVNITFDALPSDQ